MKRHVYHLDLFRPLPEARNTPYALLEPRGSPGTSAHEDADSLKVQSIGRGIGAKYHAYLAIVNLLLDLVLGDLDRMASLRQGDAGRPTQSDEGTGEGTRHNLRPAIESPCRRMEH